MLNIWRPENFHYHAKLKRKRQRQKSFFEGWYLKIVDQATQTPFAFIPGVFMGKDPHAFIQVLDGRKGQSWYHRFKLEEFRVSRETFDVHIGPNHFHRGGFTLDIDSENPAQKLKGEITFGQWRTWPVTTFSPGVMGPFGFIPVMECYHGILSLYHEVSGELNLDGRKLNYEGGRGYIEKDWGKGFPAAYVWTQSNHFAQDGVCLTASVAKIPWLGSYFRGFLVGLLHEGKLYRFMTYNGGKIEELKVDNKHMEMTIRNRTHKLEILAEKTEGALLKAPYEGEMLERVAETMTSKVQVKLSERKSGRLIYEDTGKGACLELQGKLEDILG